MNYELDLSTLQAGVVERGSTKRGELILSIAGQLKKIGAEKWFFFLNCKGGFDSDITRFFISLIKRNGDDFSTVFQEEMLDGFWIAVVFEKEFKDVLYKEIDVLLKKKVAMGGDSPAWKAEVKEFTRARFSPIISEFFNWKANYMYRESMEMFGIGYNPRMGTVKYHQFDMPGIVAGAVYERENDV